MTSRLTLESPRALAKIETILDLLAKAPATELQIRTAIRMTRPGLKPYLEKLMAEERIHITGNTRESQEGKRTYPRPIYAAGKGKNTKPLAPKTKAQVARDYRKRRNANPDQYEQAINAMRARKQIQTLNYRIARTKRLQEAGYSIPGVVDLLQNRRVLNGTHAKTPTPAQITEIIELREAGMTWTDIAEAVGVHRTTACRYYRQITL